MKLNKQETKKIAELAKLELTDEELKTYGDQMSQVFNYMEELKEVDVNDVEPTAQVTGLENVSREDVVEDWPKDEVGIALDQAPSRDKGYIKVKRIL